MQKNILQADQEIEDLDGKEQKPYGSLSMTLKSFIIFWSL